MTRTKDITSFTEFRAHLRDHLDERKSTSRPLFITTNGEAEAVLLSPSAYDALIDQAELGKSLPDLDRSMDDVKAGRGMPLKEVVRKIAAELGLKIDR